MNLVEKMKTEKTAESVSDLMLSSKSEQEWNDNCDEVKKAWQGYPSFWYEKIIMSGVAQEAKLSW